MRTKTIVGPRLAVAQLGDQVVELLALALDRQEVVLDVGLGLFGCVGVGAGVVGVGLGDLAGRALERGREEQRLALAGGAVDDPVDGGLEAHVEHPVGLVEDEDADVLEDDDAAGDQVLEAAGSGDEDVGLADGLDLRSEADAAVDGGDLQALRLGDRADVFDDLTGELAGRGEDQGADAALLGREPLDHRDAEGERLAGAGRRLDEQVVPGERVADDQLLDGEGMGDVTARERTDHRLRDAEIGK